MKPLSIALTVPLLAATLQAAPRSIDELRNVAVNFAATHSETIRNWSVADTTEMKELASPDSITTPYRLIHLKPTGWVIVSDDDVARPVLAYNLEANNTGSIPENFKAWMRGVSEQIQYAKEHYNDSPFKKEWNRMAMDPRKFLLQNRSHSRASDTAATGALKGPLLGITWNQGDPYNAKCPQDPNGPGGHVWAGCVATAMVQIMKYHNWPNKGRGRHSYQSDYGKLSANFGATKYRWNAMPSRGEVTSYNDAVATIMYHAGVAVDMDYSPNGSAASSRDADYALRTYFRYATRGMAYRDDMSAKEWDALLQKEINEHRPIYYRGDNGYSGHAFVCDGYDTRDTSNITYHFNWGWGGYYDGYYAIGDLTPGSHDFNSRNAVIYGIRPIGKIKIIAPAKLQASKITKNSAFLHWIDRSKNEQGFKIYLNGQLVKRVKANINHAKITHLVSGTNYVVQVRAYKGANESSPAVTRFKTRGKKPAIIPIRIGQKVHGTLTKKTLSTHQSGAYAKYYLLQLKQKKTVQIDESSSTFDTYLYLLKGKGKHGAILAADDDGGQGRNSRITITLQPGNYTIEATSYGAETTGNFTLSVTTP